MSILLVSLSVTLFSDVTNSGEALSWSKKKNAEKKIKSGPLAEEADLLGGSDGNDEAGSNQETDQDLNSKAEEQDEGSSNDNQSKEDQKESLDDHPARGSMVIGDTDWLDDLTKDLLGVPSISVRCQEMLKDLNKKILLKQRVESSRGRTEKAISQLPEQKIYLKKKLEYILDEINQKIYLFNLQIAVMEEEIIRNGCPGIQIGVDGWPVLNNFAKSSLAENSWNSNKNKNENKNENKSEGKSENKSDGKTQSESEIEVKNNDITNSNSNQNEEEAAPDTGTSIKGESDASIDSSQDTPNHPTDDISQRKGSSNQVESNTNLEIIK